MHEWSFFCAKWLNPWWQISRWLPSSIWVRMNEWSFFVENGWIQDGRFQDGCHHEVESECMSEVFFVEKLNPRWQISRWLPLSSWVRMNKWIFLCNIDWIQDSRIQYGCHHLFEWECMREVSFEEMAESKNGRIRECFCQSSSWEKITRCLSPDWMADVWIQHGRIQGWLISLSWIRMNEFESGSEWRTSVFEWIWEKITRCLNAKWQCLNPRWQNSIGLPSSIWVRMNEFESDWTSLSQSFVQNGWIQDGRIQYGRIQDCCHYQVNQMELVWDRVQSGGRMFLSESERR